MYASSKRFMNETRRCTQLLVGRVVWKKPQYLTLARSIVTESEKVEGGKKKAQDTQKTSKLIRPSKTTALATSRNRDVSMPDH